MTAEEFNKHIADTLPPYDPLKPCEFYPIENHNQGFTDFQSESGRHLIMKSNGIKEWVLITGEKTMPIKTFDVRLFKAVL